MLFDEPLEESEDLPAHAVVNESLSAIVAGMTPEHGDRILTVGFDQSIALLEGAGSVHCVDLHKDQIEYYMYLFGLVKEGKFQEFFDQEKSVDKHFAVEKEEYVHRTAYFSESGRLTRIRKKIDRLSFEANDFVEAANNNEFTKAYLSNIVGCYGTGYELVVNLMNVLTDALPVEGIFYVSNGSFFEPRRLEAIHHKSIQDAFKINNQRTKIAEKLQKEYDSLLTKFDGAGYGWTPIVYQKI